MVFRLQAKRIFLTYAQCPLTKEELLSELQKLPNFHQYVISRELHEDGNYHLHAIVTLTTRINTTNKRYFDVKDYHPNIVTIKTNADFSRIKTYVEKDGDFIGDLPITKKGWGAILKESTNVDEFLNNIKEEYPRDYCLNLQRLEYAATKNFKKIDTPYTPNPDWTFNIPDELTAWRTENLQVCLPTRPITHPQPTRHPLGLGR